MHYVLTLVLWFWVGFFGNSLVFMFMKRHDKDMFNFNLVMSVVGLFFIIALWMMGVRF
jgi:hypothetical protein